MIKNKFKIVLLFVSVLFLTNCGEVKDALQGQKRSEQSDEFLVKKKNPLQMPPDINKLPKPGQVTEINDNDENSGVKKLLKIKDGKNNNNSQNNSSDLINEMLKKIQ